MRTLDDWTETVINAVPALREIRHSVENELLMLAVFDGLHRRNVLPDDAVFIGGSALRLCHGSPRFSEDLDFHAPHRVTREFDREGLAETVGATTGCAISVSTPTAQGRSTLARVSAIIPGRRRDQRRPRTKIDLGVGRQVDTVDAVIELEMAGGAVHGLGTVGDLFTFKTSSREELYIDKHLALVGRAQRLKHRDIFDVLWLNSTGTRFNGDIFKAKMDALELDKTAFLGTLRQRADAGRHAILNGDYHAEMVNFLPQGSPWLFDESRVEGMADAFRAVVLDNAKTLDARLNRTVVMPHRPVERER